MPPGDSRGGPLTTDRPTAESPDEKLNGNRTPHVRPQRDSHPEQVHGTLVVVVETPGEKYRRRSYLSLRTAELTVKRAEARGYTATIVLACLKPAAGWSA